jgi:hypothetical protein
MIFHDLRFLLSFTNSPYYSEAEKHLIQDIPNYLNDITELYRASDKFNSELSEYEKILENKVENLLHQKILQLQHFIGKEVAPINSISVERLMHYFKLYWFLDLKLDTAYWQDKKWFVIMDNNIATVEQRCISYEIARWHRKYLQ